jgi:predicted alpha/beta superfamily hydrolase
MSEPTSSASSDAADPIERVGADIFEAADHPLADAGGAVVAMREGELDNPLTVEAAKEPVPEPEPVEPPEPAVPPEPVHTLTGDFRVHEGFHSRYLPVDHTVIVYLPPGYHGEPARRYPVLYLQDGQNLFDEATAFGEEWRVDETAEALIRAGQIEPLIIVGIYNTGEHRIEEYTPTRDRVRDAGGKANLYGRMLVEELKPFIDREYRTLADPANTAIGGSSLGGLVSLFLALQYSGKFWKLAILSPSVWWDRQYIVRRVRALAHKPPSRIWLSAGTAEGHGVVAGARRVRDELVRKGWVLGDDLVYLEVDGAGHDERAWADVVEPILRFLFPPK